MTTAIQILEQGKARRGERFESTRLLTMDGDKVRCRCGSIYWERSPLKDDGPLRAWVCASQCGMIARDRVVTTRETAGADDG